MPNRVFYGYQILLDTNIKAYSIMREKEFGKAMENIGK
jgi:hypothetical protein